MTVSESSLPYYGVISREREQSMTHILQNQTHSPLIGIITEEKGKEVVQYFTEEEQADRVSGGVEEALGLAGAWSDLDETLDSLDRLRHDSKPTPPIKL
jgi:hypothetical protein